jgi:hypothetical protein
MCAGLSEWFIPGVRERRRWSEESLRWGTVVLVIEYEWFIPVCGSMLQRQVLCLFVEAGDRPHGRRGYALWHHGCRIQNGLVRCSRVTARERMEFRRQGWVLRRGAENGGRRQMRRGREWWRTTEVVALRPGGFRQWGGRLHQSRGADANGAHRRIRRIASLVGSHRRR